MTYIPTRKRHCEDCGRPLAMRPLSFVKVTHVDPEPEYECYEYLTLCSPCLDERKHYAAKKPDMMAVAVMQR